MMAYTWLVCVSVLLIFEHTYARKSPARQESKLQPVTRVPQSKRIGGARAKAAKNLEERRLGQEYVEQYQEWMKASQESFESFDENRDDKRLRRLIGDDDLELMAEAGGLPRRTRSGGPLHMQSLVGRRRARSEAIRRDKLRAQSYISHRRHSKNNLPFGDN